MNYTVASISDPRRLSAVDALLLRSGLHRDPLADYICGVYDEDFHLCATGSCCQNTLRCLAVDEDYRGEQLMSMVVSHLCEVQAARGNTQLFLYTKRESAATFTSLGFYEIARTDDVVFMENRRNGFESWLGQLRCADAPREKTACVVMNANPFTKGHRYLLETVCAQNEAVHLFVLSEAVGPIAPAVRKHLVELGVADLPNIILHDSGPYIISAATFPSYFLRQDQQVSRVHAKLDIAVFLRIAQRLNIGVRCAGEEPFSQVTALYNSVMAEELPKGGVAFCEIPRLAQGEQIVSASHVRQALHDGRMEEAHAMLPESTWTYLTGEQGKSTLDAIRRANELIHH